MTFDPGNLLVVAILCGTCAAAVFLMDLWEWFRSPPRCPVTKEEK